MKYLTILIFVVTLFLRGPINGQNTDCLKEYAKRDTVTKNGNFIKYILNNNKIELEYGKGQFHMYYTEKYYCDVPNASIPWLQFDNDKFMLLLYSCGAACSQLILLPLNNLEKPKTFYNYLAYDEETTNLVYAENEHLLVENLESKKIQTFNLPKCKAPTMILCFDSVSINKSIISFNFYGPEKDKDKYVKKKYSIKIK